MGAAIGNASVAPGLCRCVPEESASSSSTLPAPVADLVSLAPALQSCKCEDKPHAAGIQQLVACVPANAALCACKCQDESPLRAHFLSDAFALGADMRTQNTGYELGTTEYQVPVYQHASTGMHVWCQPIQFTPPDAEEVEVLFHYTSSKKFHSVTLAPCLQNELWASLHQDLQHGRGVYADYREPEKIYSLIRQDKEIEFGADKVGASYCIPILVSPKMIYGYGTIGLICCDAHCLREATLNNERRFRRIVQASEATLGVDHLDTLDKMSYLAFLLDGCGKLNEAEKCYRFVMHGYEKALGPEDPDTLKSTNNLATLLQSQGRQKEAESLARRVLEGNEASLGPDHPDTLTSVNNLACLLKSLGKHYFSEAEVLFKRNLLNYEATLGAVHPSTLATMSNLAYLLNAQGNLEESEPLCCRALYLCEKALGTEHPDTLGSLNNLAVLRHKQGNVTAAESLYWCALTRCETKLSCSHPLTLLSAGHLARFLESQEMHEQAEHLYLRIIRYYEASYGVDDVRTCRVERSLLKTLKAQGKHDEVDRLRKLRSQPQEPDEVCIGRGTNAGKVASPEHEEIVGDLELLGAQERLLQKALI